MKPATSSRRRSRWVACAAAFAAVCVSAGAVLAQLPTIRTNLGEANLTWQQRFLGIIPLVKPDPKDPVIVTVNGHPITAAQVNDYAKTEARMINATSTEESRAVWKDALENLVNRQLLIDEAEKRKVSVPDAQVMERAREFRLTGISGQELSSAGKPDPLLVTGVRDSMMIEKMLDDEFRKQNVRPTDQQIKDYYDEHRDLFVKDPGQVRISHIAIKLPANATDAQKKAAKEKILKLYQMAMHTKDFAALAKKYSEDPNSASKGGDLGYFAPGQLPPVVDKKVFSTPAGKLTQMFESNIGYSFIKVTARRGETYEPLENVKAKIAMVLLDYNEDAVVKDILKKLARKAKIEFRKNA
jgi:parvulin-like peptidyl-prolyl isomerase